MDDNDVFNAAPVPAIAPSAPAPVSTSLLPQNAPAAPTPGDISGGYHITKAPPPLPQESDESLLARAGVAEGGPSPEGQTAVIRAIKQRAAVSGKPIAELLTQPGQMQTYWNGAIQGIDPNSPAYQGALKIAQTATPSPGIDSWYSPAGIKKQGFGTPPFDPSTGTMIGGQLFGHGAAWGTTNAAPAGLSPEQKAIWDSVQVQPATTPAGQQPSGGKFFTVGGQQQPVTQAQEDTLKQIASSRGWNPHGVVGFDGPPFPLMPGGVMPRTPGAHYVDLDGKEHIVPGGVGEMALGGLQGLFQGSVMDTGASGAKLGVGVGSGDPMMDALAQSQGGPSAFEQYQANRQGAAQQQRDYQIEHGGNLFAQGGRFFGQAVPATAAAALAPEIEAPAAAGTVGRMAAGGLTNALRGVVATLPSVGASDTPVTQQAATGALAGVVLPPALRAAGLASAGLVSPNASKVAPEVMDLAREAAANGVNLRASQIAGTADPALAVKDSNLVNAPGSGFATSHRQQLQAITRWVGSTFGANTDKLTPQVMNQARRDLGQGYEDFAANHSAPDVTQLHTDLDTAMGEARQVLPSSELAPLENQVANIKELTAKNGDTLPGDVFQSLTRTGSPLDRAMESKDSNIRYYAGKIHDAVNNSIMQDATDEERQAFSDLNLKYKNLMTVKGLAAKADIQGAIPARQIPAIVNRNFDRAFNDGGPLGKIADVVSTFMPNIPNSFSAQRAAEIAGRNWLPGILGGGALGEAALFHDPGLALKLGASAALAKGAQLGVNAFEGLRFGAGAGKNLIRTPGAFGNALQGVRGSVEVPLSALVGSHFGITGPAGIAGAFAGGQAGPAVGANAQ